MDKQSAIKLIRETFENTFEKERYVGFVKNLFNKISLDAFEYYGQYIPEAFKPYISKYERIGKYTTEDKRIDILIVYLNKETSIERARTMQRNFVAGYLSGKYGSDKEKDAAVVAFVSPGLEDWRFSLVKMEYKLTQTKTGRPKGEEEFTPACRYSFLVGKNEPNHTAQQHLFPILQDDINNPTLEQLEKAFSVEKVTKEFLNQYRYLYLQLMDSIDKIVKEDKNVKDEFGKKKISIVDFSKKLLGQIVFLYFLQKKGWLGVPKNKNWGEGDRNFLRSLFKKCSEEKKNFFNDYLEILFYDTLNDPRLDQVDTSYSKYFDCRIPFLNGGLFESINNYDWENTDIVIPNELFSNNEKTEEGDTGSGILDVFDRFNFTVKEDEPLEKEVAVDPEMLGKVFENLLEVKDRKSKGTYYTPREIVHYMCQESLINYLTTELEGKVNKEDIEMFIKYGDISIEHDKLVVAKKEESPEYNGKYKKIKIPESIKDSTKLIDEKLENIRVCDPAVGSGAFLVGMMLEIVKTRNVLTNYLPDKKERTPYNFKRQCIENCLYGVDIDSSAIDIAKLRFWLSLVVDEEDVTKIKPLPNLDYKLVCGNSLLGVERDLFNADAFQKLEKLKPLHFNETDTNKKQELKNQIDKLIKQITNNDERFDFEVYFSEVFHEKYGFDVVIANPPYVGEKGHKEIFREIKKSILNPFYLRKMDLFYFFLHLALNISKNNSQIAFITTNYYPTADGAKKLRQDFKERATIKHLINFNELKIFESALGQHNMITILSKAYNDSAISYNAITMRAGFATHEILQKILNWQDDETNYYSIHQKDLYEGGEHYIRLSGTTGGEKQNPIQYTLDKIKKQSCLLDSICNINQGILSGIDKITNKHVESNLIDCKYKNHGVYILNKSEIASLDLTKKEKQILMPFFKNSDIKKYFCCQEPSNYLIYATRDLDIKEYYNIYKHFKTFEKPIKARSQDRGEMQAALKLGKWWVIFAARNKEIFLKEKIVCPQRCYENNFAYNNVEWFASADVYFITPKDSTINLKYILALLNSKLYYIWLYFRGKRKGEMLELLYTPLTEIPIKKVSLTDQKPFIDLVDKILEITKDDDYLTNSAKQVKVKEYERQIDQMVYKLYGLTEEEIKIVEGVKT
jgi:hypothetical protein